MEEKNYSRAYAPDRSREWFLTISAKHIKSKETLIQRLESKNYDSFMVVREVSDGEYEHYHALIQHRNPVRFTALQNLLDKKPHIEPVRNLAKSIKYLKKDDDEPYMHGEFIIKHPGQRTDLQIMHQQIVQGKKTVDDLLDDPDFAQTALQYRRGLREVETLRYKKEARQVYLDREVFYIYGAAGGGKSTLARALAAGYDIDTFKFSKKDIHRYDHESMWLVDDYKHPYDGINPTYKTIVYDEFAGQRPITEMNRVMDIYPIIALTSRYQNVVLAHDRRIVIVSNFPISKIYQDEEEELRTAFKRRITHFVHVTKKHRIKVRKRNQ